MQEVKVTECFAEVEADSLEQAEAAVDDRLEADAPELLEITMMPETYEIRYSRTSRESEEVDPVDEGNG
jgi:hypothetical protein